MQRRIVMSALALALALAGAGHAKDLAELNGEILDLYAVMHASLAADDVAMVKTNGGLIASKAAAATAKGGDAAAYRTVAEAAGKVASALEIEPQREAFKGLSVALAKLVEAGQISGADLYFCPMADGYWLQKSADDGARNPYYGKSMLRCGSKVDKVEG